MKFFIKKHKVVTGMLVLAVFCAALLLYLGLDLCLADAQVQPTGQIMPHGR